MAIPSTEKPKSDHGTVRRSQSVRIGQISDEAEYANGAAKVENPRNNVGGWITIHGFSKLGFIPSPSVGTGMPCVPSGKNGERTNNIVTRNNKTQLYTGITCDSAAREENESTTPSNDVQNAQSRNEPSCPAQKDGSQ